MCEGLNCTQILINTNKHKQTQTNTNTNKISVYSGQLESACKVTMLQCDSSRVASNSGLRTATVLKGLNYVRNEKTITMRCNAATVVCLIYVERALQSD
jgi:hypothetical protein